MSKLLYGSMCLTDINEQAKKGHKSFSKGKNGKIYFNIKMWLNSEKDQYGNDASLLIATPKDEVDEKLYIGNLKYSEAKLSENDESIPSDSDLPF